MAQSINIKKEFGCIDTYWKGYTPTTSVPPPPPIDTLGTQRISAALRFMPSIEPFSPRLTSDELTLYNEAGSLKVKDENGVITTLIPPITTGKIFGPAFSTEDAIARFDGVTGKLIQNSSIILTGDKNAIPPIPNSTMTLPTGDFTVDSTNGNLILTAGDTVIDAIQVTAIDPVGGIDINSGTSTGIVTLDAGGAISLDAGAASNFTTSSGVLFLDGAAGIVLEGNAGPITISTTVNLVLDANSFEIDTVDNTTFALNANDDTNDKVFAIEASNSNPEITNITLPAGSTFTAGPVNGQSFILFTTTTSYHVWYEIIAAGPTVDPFITPNPIKVTILSSDNALTVATKTAAAINAVGGVGSVFSVPVPTTPTITITNTVSGVVPDAISFDISIALLIITVINQGGVPMSGLIDVDADGEITIDSTSSSVNINAVGSASNFTVTGGDLTLSTVTSGNINLVSAGTMDVDAVGDLSINSAGGSGNAINIGDDDVNFAINIGTAGARDIDIGSASTTSLTLDSGVGPFSLSSRTTFDIDAVGTIEMNSTGGNINIGNDNNSFPINIGTSGIRDITIGNAASSSMELRSGGGLDMDSDITLDINSSGGIINIGDNGNNVDINIGTGGNRIVTIGTSASAVDIESYMAIGDGSALNSDITLLIDRAGSGIIGVDGSNLLVDSSDITVGFDNNPISNVHIKGPEFIDGGGGPFTKSASLYIAGEPTGTGVVGRDDYSMLVTGDSRFRKSLETTDVITTGSIIGIDDISNNVSDDTNKYTFSTSYRTTTTTGTGNYTVGLEDGVNGQIKMFSMSLKSGGDDVVLTPTSTIGFTSVTFNTTGDGAVLLYIDNGAGTNGWVVIGRNGVAVA